MNCIFKLKYRGWGSFEWKFQPLTNSVNCKNGGVPRMHPPLKNKLGNNIHLKMAPQHNMNGPHSCRQQTTKTDLKIKCKTQIIWKI